MQLLPQQLATHLRPRWTPLRRAACTLFRCRLQSAITCATAAVVAILLCSMRPLSRLLCIGSAVRQLPPSIPADALGVSGPSLWMRERLLVQACVCLFTRKQMSEHAMAIVGSSCLLRVSGPVHVIVSPVL